MFWGVYVSKLTRAENDRCQSIRKNPFKKVITTSFYLCSVESLHYYPNRSNPMSESEASEDSAASSTFSAAAAGAAPPPDGTEAKRLIPSATTVSTFFPSSSEKTLLNFSSSMSAPIDSRIFLTEAFEGDSVFMAARRYAATYFMIGFYRLM